MARLTQKIPVQFSLLAPLLILAEVLSHKQQFLSRMADHIGIACLQVLELVLSKTRHLIDHRAFQMDNLVMRKDQDKVLAVSVSNREGHLIMVIFSEIRIQFHVLQEVMHPSHIPFQAEAQAAVLGISGNQRPGCGFFSAHHSPFILSKDHGI